MIGEVGIHHSRGPVRFRGPAGAFNALIFVDDLESADTSGWAEHIALTVLATAAAPVP